LVASLVKYYEAGGHEDSSELTYGRWIAQHEAGASTENIARLEAAAGIGIMSNTVPSTFWTLFEIYSRPELLAECRKEIEEHAIFIEGEGSEKVYNVDLACIRDRCHVLVSAFQETLRMRSNGAPTRWVYDDIMLDNKYLLKAGSVVQMPSPSVNREGATWGADSKEFNPHRFRPRADGARMGGRATGYMSFGAAPNMCAGRHFAAGEIMALIGMVLLRYDISPVAGGWKSPKLNVKALAASVTPPVDAFPVKVTERSNYSGTNWDFKVTEGMGKFNLVVG
jgi:cytochrome P450